MKKIILLCFFTIFISANETNSTCPISLVDTRELYGWKSKINLKSGKIQFFSSSKAMFEYIYKIYDFNDLLVQMFVSDYNSKKLINAKDAFYVFGSNIISVNGDDLISFKSKDEAIKFKEQTSGSRVLEFKDINERLIDFLNER